MTTTTRPSFIVSLPHSGQDALAPLIAASSGVDFHENYMAIIHQPLGVHRYMRLVDDELCLRTLRETSFAAVHYSEKPAWIDCSSALTCLVPPLAHLFPAARFVHLVRDGRAVVAASLRHSAQHCYSDRATSILQHHYDNPESFPAPPPEPQLWWPLPPRDHPIADRFRLFSQLERTSWHWAEMNRVIIRALSKLEQKRYIRVHLEDLLSSPLELRRLIEFLDLSLSDEAFLCFARQAAQTHPPLAAEDTRAFRSVAWGMMEFLGYASTKEIVTTH